MHTNFEEGAIDAARVLPETVDGAVSDPGTNRASSLLRRAKPFFRGRVVTSSCQTTRQSGAATSRFISWLIDQGHDVGQAHRC